MVSPMSRKDIEPDQTFGKLIRTGMAKAIVAQVIMTEIFSLEFNMLELETHMANKIEKIRVFILCVRRK